jgi:hypothetical protein
MRVAPVIAVALLALAASPAAAQITDPAISAQQTDLWAQQQLQRQQALDQERQAFVQEQQAQTRQALSNLEAARQGQPAPVQPVVPAYSAAWRARADQLRILGDELAARPIRLAPIRRR